MARSLLSPSSLLTSPSSWLDCFCVVSARSVLNIKSKWIDDMAWRFKASKYKNAAPIVPKPEACVRDICVGSYQTYGNNIAASAAFMAFNWEHTGSSLAVLSIDDCGRKSKTMPLVHAHTDTITDIQFSPFHDGLLATGSQDCLVKIWNIPEKGLESSLTEPECSFSHKQRRVETVGFHPSADCLLHSTAASCITLFDLACQKEIFCKYLIIDLFIFR